MQAFAGAALNTTMPPQITPDEFLQQIVTRTGLQPGWIDDARRAATPHAAEWLGLTREDLGDADFEEKLWEARHWCKERCPTDHEIEPIRDQGRLVGRQFRFAKETDATLFKLWFLWSAPTLDGSEQSSYLPAEFWQVGPSDAA